MDIKTACDELAGVLESQIDELDALHTSDFLELKQSVAALAARVVKLEAPQPVPVPQPPKPVTKLGAVSYYRAGPRWAQLIALGASKVGCTILNPSSGPGALVDPTYLAQVKAVQAAGIKVIGYLTSNYLDKFGVQTGETPPILRDPANLKNITDEMDRLMAMYSLDGFFVDELLNDGAPTTLQAYASLSSYAKSKWPGCLVVLNPGTGLPESYMGLADAFMTFESTAAKYRTAVVPPWAAKYPSSKFWHVVHTTTPAEYAEVVALAKQRNVGLLWVTDDVMPNPYDTNPSYLDALAAEITK